MKRILKILIAVLAVGVVIGGILAYQASRVVEEGVSAPKVLGETQQSLQGFISSIGPAVDQAVGIVSSGVSTLTDKVLVEDQKVQVDKAFQDIKNDAANIPEHVFNEAKYNYCKQVVIDYETTR